MTSYSARRTTRFARVGIDVWGAELRAATVPTSRSSSPAPVSLPGWSRWHPD
ncbi:lipase domain protein [Mycobacterium ulcerans str. Harvey]|uniref:Lipase domain protein n=1 Tax=Mycobacterium ulcerans str. Harvey TaxID=1299332 RepID=A0ABP3AMM9_MYCUL|nr:lipase domain protein [Mycobacterium ulcerans str. Harvey]